MKETNDTSDDGKVYDLTFDGDKAVFTETASLSQTKSSKKKKHTVRYYFIEGIRKVIMLAALCVFTYSSYELTNIYLDYKDGDDAYDNMEKMFEVPDIQVVEEQTDEFGNTVISSNQSIEWTYDFQKLLNANSDAVGWIKQDNIISYPIVAGTDNTYYLTHNALHVENKAGAIFLDYRVEGGLEANNCIIYGHDMLNDSMFGTLIKYRTKSYYDAHPTFDIYIGEKHYKYYVFAAYETDQIGDTYSYNFASDEEFQNYINLCLSKRLYATNVSEVTVANKIVTLSTCTRHDQSKRMIVQLIRGEEIT